jgi:hypothetical protein
MLLVRDRGQRIRQLAIVDEDVLERFKVDAVGSALPQ